MDADRILRGDQQEEEPGRLAIHGIEINPLAAEPEGDQLMIEMLELAVGDGHAVTDAGAPQALTLQQHPDHLVPVERRIGGDQGLGQFGQNIFFSRSPEFRDDRGGVQHFGNLYRHR